MQVSIVVPVYNALALTKQCLKSIFDHSSSLSFEVVVVDNGSAPDVERWGLQQQQEHGNLRYLRYPEPLGFAKSVNAGATVCTGEVLIILNSDTLVTPGWMEELYHALMTDPSLGALTPCTNHAGEPAQMDFSTIDLPAAKALAMFAKRPKRPSIFYLPQRLTFFCIAIRREVWLKFGGLDEAYPVGNFEDDDLCLRLRVAGYRLGVAQHVFVYHHNNATFTANKISHAGWMDKNAATFALRAREFSEAAVSGGPLTTRWPKRSGHDISVVILPHEGGSLERTLRSLANQTVVDFEVILPTDTKVPTRLWIAYLDQGDIVYPFHLEALFDALERNGTDSIFADGWVKDAETLQVHPDASRHIRDAPFLLAGWMHHSSLHRDRLREESVPMHWPRMTWEMQSAPSPAANRGLSESRTLSPVEMARSVYRRAVPYEMRLAMDRAVRRIIGRPLPDPDLKQMQTLAAHLEALRADGVDAGKFVTDGALPAVILFNAVAWNSVIQRQHHFARGLAERGHTVFWVEPALSSPRNWWNSRPLQQLVAGIHMIRLPGTARDIYTLEWNEAIVDAMAAAVAQTASVYGVQQAVMLINYPRWQPVAKLLRERCEWKIAFDCLDDQRAFAHIYQTTLFTYEDWLAEHADLLVTSSAVLQERLFSRPSTLLHNAADYDLFSSGFAMGYLDHLPRPIVGFFGALADWLDMDLIRAAALRFPDWTFVYIGPHTFSHSSVELDWLRSTHLPNIVVIPQMDPHPLAAHLAEFDVCTMPFKDIPATRSMNPVKLYEYLAAGKPVVCRDLPEVSHLVDSGAAGLISLYKSPEEFFELLRLAVAEDDDDLRERRRAFARANDWDARMEELSGLLVDLAKL
jgi:GT2 family glycosyltransferase/glycosyltransferase involved in cell wall biosynthesis